MQYTTKLGLPVFNDPSTDKFKIDTWNQGNQNIEKAIVKIETDNTNINNTFNQINIDHKNMKQDIEDIKNSGSGNISQLEEKVNNNKTAIGDLTELHTTNKNNLVISINEVAAKIEAVGPGGGGSGEGPNTTITNEVIEARQGKRSLLENIQGIKTDITKNITNISNNTNNINNNLNKINSLNNIVSNFDNTYLSKSGGIITGPFKIKKMYPSLELENSTGTKKALISLNENNGNINIQANYDQSLIEDQVIITKNEILPVGNKDLGNINSKFRNIYISNTLQLKRSKANANGYNTLPNGMIEQWGYIENVGDNWNTITLQIPYADNNYNIQLTNYWVNGWYVNTVGNITRENFQISAHKIDNTQGTTKIFWRTIGWE